MEDMFSLTPVERQKNREISELKKCNNLTIKFGLSLSDQQIKTIVEKRFESLKAMGRIEFGEGVITKLIYSFCDSPYISQENYEDTLCELQEIFYYFKNEAMELISDDELIEFMKRHFDNECQGSLDYLNGTSLEELCRDTRYGYKKDEDDDENEDEIEDEEGDSDDI